MSRKFKSWSAEEDNKLRELWDGRASWRMIEHFDGRGVRSISRRARMLGLDRRSWTDKETKILANNWTVAPESELLEMLPGWHMDQIRQQAQKLGIKGRPKKFYRKLADVSLKALENEIVKPGIEDHLIPLLEFKGGTTLGHQHRYFNHAVSMMLHECEDLSDGTRISFNPDYAHLCMPERQIEYRQLYSFFSRLVQKKKVADNVPGLFEYAKFICPNPLQLQPLSRYTHRRDAAWWRIYKPKQRKYNPFARVPERKVHETRYPFLVHEPKQRDDHELMLLVNNAVPKNLPEQFRADICQDLIVALLCGDITKDEVKGSVQDFTRKVFKMFPTKYGALSMDAPAPWMDDGRTLAETLSVGEVY